MKWLMILALLAIVGALAAAGVAMLRRRPVGEPPSQRMMHALALRVALSVTLFLAVVVAYLLGWIQPTGLPRG